MVKTNVRILAQHRFRARVATPDDKSDPLPGPSADASELPVSTRTIIESGGLTQRKLHVFCPMFRRNVGLDLCVDCPNCAGFDSEGSADRRPLVLCTYPARPVASRSRPVGSMLTRHSVCVRLDALPEGMTTVPPSASAVAVIDEQTRLVGVVLPGSGRVIDAPPRLVQEELTPVAEALVLMAGCRARQAPVVADDGSFVGVVDDLSLVRALAVRSP